MSAITPDQMFELQQAMRDQAEHLHGMRLALEAMLVDIAIGGSETDRIVDDSPVEGHRRRSISHRRLQGSDSFAVPSGAAAIVLLMPSNPGRLGGQIVNVGSNAVVVVLGGHSSYVAGATPALWLASSGGAWDLTFGKSVYSGPVSVFGSGGTSTITWAAA